MCEVAEQVLIKVDCVVCGNMQSITANKTDVERYLSDQNLTVQKVWPDAETNWRELMIGFRNNLYLCPIHWD